MLLNAESLEERTIEKSDISLSTLRPSGSNIEKQRIILNFDIVEGWVLNEIDLGDL